MATSRRRWTICARRPCNRRIDSRSVAGIRPWRSGATWPPPSRTRFLAERGGRRTDVQSPSLSSTRPRACFRGLTCGSGRWPRRTGGPTGSRSREDPLRGDYVTARHILVGPVILAALLLSDSRWALIVAGLVLLLDALTLIADRVTFTFAEGFLPFRPKDGWPRGVQEDDDVRWDWSPTAGLSDRARLRGHDNAVVWDPRDVSAPVRAVRPVSGDQRSPTIEAPTGDRRSSW